MPQGAPPLYITEEDVARLVTVEDAVACLEEAFAAWGDPGTRNIPRGRAPVPGAIYHLLGAAYEAKRVFGFKSYFGGAAGAVYHTGIYSMDEGRLAALIESDLAGQLRTGAASGLATKLLANPDVKTLGVIGTGKQARAQLLAIRAVRPLESVRVWSRSPDNRERFAREMEAETGLEVRPAASVQECAEGADIIATITKAAEPVLRTDWVADGAHVNAAGANAATRRELDREMVVRADLCVTDDRAQAMLEAGEFRDAAAAEELSWDDVHELGNIVRGAVPGRGSRDDVTLFKSLGIALEDMALGELIYRRALEADVGRPL